jgi:hypothetical protein
LGILEMEKRGRPPPKLVRCRELRGAAGHRDGWQIEGMEAVGEGEVG